MYCLALIDDDLAISIINNGIDLDLNEPWDYGQSPLHIACQMNMIDTVKILLSKEHSFKLNIFCVSDDFLVQCNHFESGGKTCLHYAALNGCNDIVEMLIKFYKRDDNYFQEYLSLDKFILIDDFDGNNCIDCAIMNRHFKCAKFLYQTCLSHCDNKKTNTNDNNNGGGNGNLNDNLSIVMTDKILIDDPYLDNEKKHKNMNMNTNSKNENKNKNTNVNEIEMKENVNNKMEKYVQIMSNDTNMQEYNIQLTKKRLEDSKSSRLRFNLLNNLIIKSDNGKFNHFLSQQYIYESFLTKKECNQFLQAIKNYVLKNGWTNNRHRSYATTDIPSHMLGDEIDTMIKTKLSRKLFPFIIEKYGKENFYSLFDKYTLLNKIQYCNKNEKKKNEKEKEEEEKKNNSSGDNDDDMYYFDFGFRDLFFVFYDVYKQNELALHRDGSIISFNILLNNENDFENGGTYIKHSDKVIKIKQGDCLCHSGKILHAGNKITKGQRYILVGFLDGKKRHKRYRV